MDEIEIMVAETFRHFQSNFSHERAETAPLLNSYQHFSRLRLIPTQPGLIYHLQKTASLFVVRTLVSKNLREDYEKIISAPENYPSLRLLEGGASEVDRKIQFFNLDNHLQAEIIHDQVANRRFPIDEEVMCNLSDPGFSWWLTKKTTGFQLSFTLSVRSEEQTIKLGPLGDQQLAQKRFQQMEGLVHLAGLSLNIENESNRVQFNQGEDIFLDQLRDVFEYGKIGQTMTDLFKLFARRVADRSQLETIWLYLEEIAAIRRFWMQIQNDLENARG
jgi:hypothetical protein